MAINQVLKLQSWMEEEKQVLDKERRSQMESELKKREAEVDFMDKKLLLTGLLCEYHGQRLLCAILGWTSLSHPSSQT